jgi:hypothetical protein
VISLLGYTPASRIPFLSYRDAHHICTPPNRRYVTLGAAGGLRGMGLGKGRDARVVRRLATGYRAAVPSALDGRFDRAKPGVSRTFEDARFRTFIGRGRASGAGGQPCVRPDVVTSP